MLARLFLSALGLVSLLSGDAPAQPVAGGDLWTRAVAAQECGDLDQASKLYAELLRSQPGLIPARANLASAQAQLGRWPEAIANFAKVLEQTPSNHEVRLNLAQAYYATGDWERATRELDRLHTARPTEQRVTLLLGDCYLRAGGSAEAVPLLEAAERRAPTDPDVAYLLGMAQIRAGHPELGVVRVERVAKAKRSADAYLPADATRYRMAQLAEAREDLETAIQINPQMPAAYAWVGQVRDQVADEEGAKSAFAKALEFDPDNFDAHLHLGAILLRDKEYEAAAPHLEASLARQARQHVGPLRRCAIALRNRGMDESLALLEQVTQAAPNWVEPHVKLATLYFTLHRADEGQREQAVVERLNAERRNEMPE